MADQLKPFEWKPGQSGNPSGRPKMPSEIVKAKKLNQIELERIFNEALHFSQDELKQKRSDPNTTVLEHVVYSILSIANNKGDHQRLEFILSRLLGKTPQRIEVTGADGVPISMEDKRVQIFNLLKDDEGQKALDVITQRLPTEIPRLPPAE